MPGPCGWTRGWGWLWSSGGGGAAGGVAGVTGMGPGGDAPPAGARAQVAAIPADIGASAAAIGDQLGSRQADTAQPATLYPVMPLAGQVWLPWTCHACSPPVPAAAVGPANGKPEPAH